jgi:hypothetical protein
MNKSFFISNLVASVLVLPSPVWTGERGKGNRDCWAAWRETKKINKNKTEIPNYKHQILIKFQAPITETKTIPVFFVLCLGH